jgi:hypothetical protein
LRPLRKLNHQTAIATAVKIRKYSMSDSGIGV